MITKMHCGCWLPRPNNIFAYLLGNCLLPRSYLGFYRSHSTEERWLTFSLHSRTWSLRISCLIGEHKKNPELDMCSPWLADRPDSPPMIQNTSFDGLLFGQGRQRAEKKPIFIALGCQFCTKSKLVANQESIPLTLHPSEISLIHLAECF